MIVREERCQLIVIHSAESHASVRDDFYFFFYIMSVFVSVVFSFLVANFQFITSLFNIYMYNPRSV